MEDDGRSYASLYGRKSGYAGRMEVVSGPTGRRRWPDEVKARIVAETFRDGASVAEVARRHDLSAPQLHAWRRRAREGALALVDDEDDPLGLIPVAVIEGSETATPSSDAPSSIVIEFAGFRVHAPGDVDEATLACVLRAVRAAA